MDESDRRDNYGISQSDVYQLFAYSPRYLAEQARQRVVLIYPRTNSFQKPLRPFWYRQDHEVLYVLPYDLETDQLIVDKNLFLVSDTSTTLTFD